MVFLYKLQSSLKKKVEKRIFYDFAYYCIMNSKVIVLLLVTGNYNCSCNTGYALQSDGRKCKALGNNCKLLNQVSELYHISAMRTRVQKVKPKMAEIDGAIRRQSWTCAWT